jgi:hypothetical protein
MVTDPNLLVEWDSPMCMNPVEECVFCDGKGIYLIVVVPYIGGCHICLTDGVGIPKTWVWVL